MNKLSLQKRVRIISCLVEGMSIRGTGRVAGVAKNTVTRLLAEVGEACQWYQDANLRSLSCKRVQIDEIWSFVGKKQRQVTEKDDDAKVGDVWTWTAICADTKLVPSWLVGSRDAAYARAFVEDLASRLSERIQLTSDGHKPYLEAVEAAFGGDIDFAMLVKTYGEPVSAGPERKYSPPVCNGARKTIVAGTPDPKHVSTSYVERQNLTMRMAMRRFTRLTNAFSKKIENHAFAVSLHFMHYNFVRVHKSLRVSPAMAAGVSETLWSIEDIVKTSDAYWLDKSPPKPRGPYKPRTISK